MESESKANIKKQISKQQEYGRADTSVIHEVKIRTIYVTTRSQLKILARAEI